MCHDSHDLDGLLLASCTNNTCRSLDESPKISGRLKSPELSGNELPHRSSSPRLKPNVLNHEISTDFVRAAPVGNCRCSSNEGRSNLVHRDGVVSHNNEQNGSTRNVCSAEIREVGNNSSSTCLTNTELGAIPKHHEAWSTVVEKTAYPEHGTRGVGIVESPLKIMKSLANQQLVTAEKPTSLDVPPHQICRKYAISAKETGNDSSSSSPDIDSILTKTLMTSRCEPLSPQEMEVYLSSLYRRHMRKAKSISSAGRTDDSDSILDAKTVNEVGTDRQLKAKSIGPCVGTEGFPCKNVGYCTPDSGRLGPYEAKLMLADILRNEIPKSEAGIQRSLGMKLDLVHSLERCYIDQTEDAIERDGDESDSVFLEGTVPSRRMENISAASRANRKLFAADSPDEPVFIVGEDSVDSHSDKQCGSNQQAPAILLKKSDLTQPAVAFHKSASCPNKKSLGSAGGFHKASSLLKNMMKKEMQPTVAAHEVNAVLFVANCN